MFKTVNLGRNLLIALILSVFVLPVANAALVEIYINDSIELTESEEEFVIRSGKDLDLEIRLKGEYRIESGNESLSVASIYIDVYFESDTDRRNSTSGLPNHKAHDGLDPGYDRFVSAFKGDDTRFEKYEGPIRFSIIMKNSDGEMVRDAVIIITMEAPPSNADDSSGFSLDFIPTDIIDYWEYILGGIVGLFILSFGIYRFILAPEDTTADVYRTKESIDPLKKSLTGVGYESELPKESKKLHRLENRNEEPPEEDDEIDLDDDEDDDDDFDESKLLAELTGSQPLKDTSEDEEDEPKAPKKKPVKKRVAKRTIAKKKVIRKAAPTEPDVNMGQGIIKVTCPSCEKIHNIEDTTSKFICSCGRRIRV